MSDKLPETNSSDEIDIGQVFKIIGKFFKNLLNFLKTLALFLFDLIMKFLLLIKEHILKFLITGVVCFVLGFIADLKSIPIYNSSMIVQPNFGSTNQLYTTIKYYNGLTEISDSISLKNIFGFTSQEAASIISFKIEPLRDENEMLNKFDFFQSNIKDSIDTPELGYYKFKNNIDPTEFLNHVISVESSNPLIFEKLNDSIIKESSINNKFINKNRKAAISNNSLEEKALTNQQEKIDSLSSVYRSVLIKSAEKSTSSGTNIQLASNQIKTNEMDLFKLEKQINQSRQELNSKRIIKDDIINVVTSFPKRGREIEVELMDKLAFKLPFIGSILLLVFFLLKSLNTYLNNYKKQINV